MAVAIGALHALLLLVLVSNLLYLRRRPRRVPGDAMPPLSVLVPARNEEANLARLLPSLLSQDYPAFEVIVYDDASEDGTARVLAAHGSERLRVLHGEGPPPGWIGKVHALYQATRGASGDVYLFLDADACLPDPQALRRLVARFLALPDGSVLTGLTRLRGGGRLAVSLVPFVILCQLPWALVGRVRSASLGALNGQCWMIAADAYRRHEPHLYVRDEILEDVLIGRHLKRRGMTPALVDVQDEVSVHMYADLPDAWRGFRKNAYLLAGGRPLPFVVSFVVYALCYVLAALFSPWLLVSLVALKTATDLRSRFPWWLPLLAPLSFLLGACLLLDSAVSHLTRRVTWKARRV